MLSFITCSVPLRLSTLHTAPATSKRLRMCTTDNRSTEFQLTPSEKPKAPPPDWNAWTEEADAVLTLPALPFPPGDVFLPGETKQLHLFEARYLALLETTTADFDSRCAHVLIDSRRRAMAAVGTLLHVREWTRLDVGVSVVVDAVGRLHTTKLLAAAPFVTAKVSPIADSPLLSAPDAHQLPMLYARFWVAFRSTVDLALHLKLPPCRPKDNIAALTIASMRPGGVVEDDTVSVPADTFAYEMQLKEAAARVVGYRALRWGDSCDDEAMVVLRAYALSFAGWDFFTSDAQQRQRANEERNTLPRLQIVVEALELRVKELSARKALNSAFTL